MKPRCTLALIPVLICFGQIASATPLPAGPYYGAGYVPQTCPACAKARYAVGWVETTLKKANARAAKLTGMRAGYPLVKTLSEVGVRGPKRNIAVIAGLFASRRQAQAWKKARSMLGSAVVLRVKEPTDRTYVVEIARGGGGPAYASAVLAKRLDGSCSATDLECLGSKPPERCSACTFKGLKAACSVKPGQRFLLDHHDRSKAVRQINDNWWAWHPVRCGKTVALVQAHRTLAASTIISAKARRRLRIKGEPIVTGKLRKGKAAVIGQVISVECDTPTVRFWTYGKSGRGRHIVDYTPEGC